MISILEAKRQRRLHRKSHERLHALRVRLARPRMAYEEFEYKPSKLTWYEKLFIKIKQLFYGRRTKQPS